MPPTTSIANITAHVLPSRDGKKLDVDHPTNDPRPIFRQTRQPARFPHHLSHEWKTSPPSNMIITSQEPTNPANGTKRPNLQVDPVGNSFLSHHPWQKMPIRQNRPKGLQHDSCATENFFSKPYNNRCKALEGSHNNHSNSTNREEEFSFKAPPKTSFAALTTHVLPSNVITSHESTNPANGPRPIFGWWTRQAAPFYHTTPRTKDGASLRLPLMCY